MTFRFLLFALCLTPAAAGFSFWGLFLPSDSLSLGRSGSSGFLSRTPAVKDTPKTGLMRKEAKKMEIEADAPELDAVVASVSSKFDELNSRSTAVDVGAAEERKETTTAVPFAYEMFKPPRRIAENASFTGDTISEAKVAATPTASEALDKLMAIESKGITTAVPFAYEVFKPPTRIEENASLTDDTISEAKVAAISPATEAPPATEEMAEETDTLHYEWEAKLIKTMIDEHHERPCIAHCRYGEESRHSWPECVERCVENGMTKRLLLAGLPADSHEAVHLEAEAPAGIDDLKKMKAKRARAEEL